MYKIALILFLVVVANSCSKCEPLEKANHTNRSEQVEEKMSYFNSNSTEENITDPENDDEEEEIKGTITDPENGDEDEELN